MHEDHPPLKKSWVQGLLTRSRSDNNLSRRSSATIPSASQSSFNLLPQPRSGKGDRGLLGKFFKTRHSRSAGQSLGDPSPMISGSNAQDHSSNHMNQNPSQHAVPASNANLDQGTDSGAEKSKLPVPMERIGDANKAVAGMSNFSGIVRNTPSAPNDLQAGLDIIDTISPIIAPLKVFNSIVNGIADIHPYAKAVLSIFTCASKMILDQEDRDNAVRDLLKKLSEVYTFMNEDGRLAEITSMQVLYGKVARQTLECADFIVHYSETRSVWERLAKNVFKETNALIQSYNNVFDSLMQQFRDRAVRDIIVNVHHFAEDLDFKDMVYVDGAGRDTSKRCLPGTREDILSEIKNWIDSTGEDVPHIFWLNGTAGKGKSAIAHTIADWFHERGGPGAFFCFDRTREAERRHEKIFTTIARDLADGDPIARRVLASVVRDNNELRHTKDIMRQWKEFILGPLDAASKAVTAPVLIVIDALDESGDAHSREQILRVLASKQDTITSNQIKLPANVRVLITSRPLGDIHTYLHGALHVRHISMDDNVYVSLESSRRDIQLYIFIRLKDLQIFTDGDLERLAVKSDGLFEWARLACEYIKDPNILGKSAKKRFEAILAGTSEKGTRLLDKMYRRILEDIMPEDVRHEAIPLFRSVMGQILALLEPLPMTALTAMQQHFPLTGDDYEVNEVIRPLASLVTGTMDSDIPIRPLHASFYDFLTDESRSNAFFVDASLAQRKLALASLGVMQHGLRFNICSLESSYLPNSAIPDLEERVKESISPELSYSCRFWGAHVGATSAEPLLAEQVGSFFREERLLFWLEAVALLKVLGGSVASLSRVAGWLTGHAEYTDTANAIRDTQRFVRTFAPAILRSTPHLYLSALPLAPIQSTISKFAARFPFTPRIVSGHVQHWPSMEKTIYLDSWVVAVAISPDGRRIVCGSEDGTIHIRDMETGEVLGAPLLGHTECIQSVAISPNGQRIVSASDDKTIRVWDAGTGEALGAPLQGHTDWVLSVAISPDGTRIVSGSADNSIMVWDMETRKALGDPLQGHTDCVWSVAISLDGTRIASGSDDTTIRTWDMETGKALGVPFQGHTDSVGCVAFSPDGNQIVSGSDDYTIQVWDTFTGQALRAPLQGHNGTIYAVVISLDGTSIVSGSDDMMIRVWDAQTGEALDAPLQGHTATVRSLAISPDGHHIVSCAEDSTIRVWDADAHKLFAPPEKYTSWIRSAVISPDGNRIVSGSDDNMIRVWDAYTGKELGAPFQGHTGEILCIAISLDGNLIVSGSYDETIRMWNAMTGEAIGVPLQGHTGEVLSVTISPDGKHIVSGSADEMVRVWDAVTGGASYAPLQGHTDSVQSVAISPDGNLIVSGSDDKTIRRWNAITGEAIGVPLQGHTDEVLSVVISPDGKRIISGSTDETIRIWDALTGETLSMPLQGHSDPVQSIAISADGNLIVSGSYDKTIRVWDARTGEALGVPLKGHAGFVLSVVISPDGKRIVSGSGDMTIRVWDLEFFIQSRFFKSPAMQLSLNPLHALRSPSSFLQDFHTSVSLVPNEEGWVVGPDDRLLLWIPASLYPMVYVPHTLVIPDNALQVDLSHFAHGMSWPKCRDHDGTLSL